MLLLLSSLLMADPTTAETKADLNEVERVLDDSNATSGDVLDALMRINASDFMHPATASVVVRAYSKLDPANLIKLRQHIKITITNHINALQTELNALNMQIPTIPTSTPEGRKEHAVLVARKDQLLHQLRSAQGLEATYGITG